MSGWKRGRGGRPPPGRRACGAACEGSSSAASLRIRGGVAPENTHVERAARVDLGRKYCLCVEALACRSRADRSGAAEIVLRTRLRGDSRALRTPLPIVGRCFAKHLTLVHIFTSVPTVNGLGARCVAPAHALQSVCCLLCALLRGGHVSDTCKLAMHLGRTPEPEDEGLKVGREGGVAKGRTGDVAGKVADTGSVVGLCAGWAAKLQCSDADSAPQVARSAEEMVKMLRWVSIGHLKVGVEGAGAGVGGVH
eukprot:scaffold41451_cov28-Tisochrysis_lutea.AAC.3